MVDRVLLSASPANVDDCVALAVQRGLGIELMAFSDPRLLDGDWQQAVEHYRALLRPVPGMLAMHGPFMDMSPGSPDLRIAGVTTERYQQAIRIAAQLGIEVVVFHANFIAALKTELYRHSWQEHNVAFWAAMAEYAARQNVTLAVENMWEFDPNIIGDVVKAVDHPRLRACLDVGHAYLYSQVPLAVWLSTLGPYLVHAHMNNNDGRQDLHCGFDSSAGVIDYHAVLERIRALPTAPTITLEMETVDDMRDSLAYFHLPEPGRRWRDDPCDHLARDRR